MKYLIRLIRQKFNVIFMGDGVIVEEGTSHQIFEDPQKEQTKEFLSRFRNS